MKDCLFCKIVNNDIPSVKIREDEDFIAILDLFPNRKGMTLVIPKKHFDSDIFNIPDIDLLKYTIATKKVAKILKKGLKVEKIGVVVEGLEVNHAHIRLYPFYEDNMGFTKGFKAGPQATHEELQTIANEIKENNKKINHQEILEKTQN